MTQIPDHLTDVGPGWTSILEGLHTGIVALDPEYQVAQVKEKFGGLRVYLDREPDEINALIREAMAEADHTCEECGESGHPSTDTPEGKFGWIKTLCPDHHAARVVTRQARWYDSVPVEE